MASQKAPEPGDVYVSTPRYWNSMRQLSRWHRRIPHWGMSTRGVVAATTDL